MKFPGLSSILGPPKLLGIDIGTTSIKAVELGRDGGVIKLSSYGLLENYGHLERINDAIQTSSLKIMDEMTADLLKRLLQEMKPSTRTAVLSIPVFSSFVTLMEFPQMTEKEINQAVPYQARQYVPIPLTEVALDWMVLGQTSTADARRIQILLIAVPQDVIAKYHRIAQLANLELRALELETVALARAVIGRDPSPTVLADIGARATNISIVDEGYVRMTRSIDTAGGDLTQAISYGLNLSPIKAEEVKRARGIRIVPGEEEMAGLLRPMLDLIISEIQKLADVYLERNKREVRKVVLSGGSSVLPGVREYFSQELNREVIVGNPFIQAQYDPMLEPILKDIGPLLSVSAGLAMRELIY
jgi:type IV pilus assembly protein PilM